MFNQNGHHKISQIKTSKAIWILRFEPKHAGTKPSLPNKEKANQKTLLSILTHYMKATTSKFLNFKFVNLSVCSWLCWFRTQIYVKSKTAQSCILDSDTVDLDLLVNFRHNYCPNLSNLWLTVLKFCLHFFTSIWSNCGWIQLSINHKYKHCQRHNGPRVLSLKLESSLQLE